MYEQLASTFPDYTHFYYVNGMTLYDAQDRCVRLSGDQDHVLNYNGQILYCAKHAISSEISWLLPVSGNPE